MVCTEDTGGCVDQDLSLMVTDSIVYEFGLYCEGRVMRVVCESCFFLGSIFGTIFFTFYQMRRKKFLVFSWLLTFLGLLGAGLSPCVEAFIGFWSLTGFASYSCYVMSNTMTKEQSSFFFFNLTIYFNFFFLKRFFFLILSFIYFNFFFLKRIGILPEGVNILFYVMGGSSDNFCFDL